MVQLAAPAPSLSSALRGGLHRGESNYIKESVLNYGRDRAQPRDARMRSQPTKGLPEGATSVLVTAVAVGTAAAAAAILMRTSKISEVVENDSKPCEACAGSGICTECNGEGFVLKKMSRENAETARSNAKNLATRYTAGLPKKWSYCTKCSSARYCIVCNGSGQSTGNANGITTPVALKFQCKICSVCKVGRLVHGLTARVVEKTILDLQMVSTGSVNHRNGDTRMLVEISSSHIFQAYKLQFTKQTMVATK